MHGIARVCDTLAKTGDNAREGPVHLLDFDGFQPTPY
jgi:hypothetical protein